MSGRLTMQSLPGIALALLTMLLTACGGGTSTDAPVPITVQRPSVTDQPHPALSLPYTEGSIRPNHLSDARLAQQRLTFYQQWKSLYVVQACGEGRYFVKVNADGKSVGGGTAPNTITVSEAHGYGMLISVLMADEDRDARTVFDGMVLYFRDHPASTSPGLMAWDQVNGCKNAGGGVRGNTSATDGDLDIAYALLLADRKWGSGGAINYKQQAQQVLQAIMAFEVHPVGKHLMIGDWAGIDEDATYKETTRTSDFMLSHLKAFQNSTGDARWGQVHDRTYAIIDLIQRTFSRGTGLMPDFVYRLDGTAAPAPAKFLEGDNDGNYSWNASRFPWRVALDYLIYGDARARNALMPFNSWARAVAGNDPSHFAAGYSLDGKATEPDSLNELAFVSGLGASAMIDSGNQVWLNRIWDDLQSKELKDGDYYGNTLKMLSMITMSGRWARPD